MKLRKRAIVYAAQCVSLYFGKLSPDFSALREKTLEFQAYCRGENTIDEHHAYETAIGDMFSLLCAPRLAIFETSDIALMTSIFQILLGPDPEEENYFTFIACVTRTPCDMARKVYRRFSRLAEELYHTWRGSPVRAYEGEENQGVIMRIGPKIQCLIRGHYFDDRSLADGLGQVDMSIFKADMHKHPDFLPTASSLRFLHDVIRNGGYPLTTRKLLTLNAVTLERCYLPSKIGSDTFTCLAKDPALIYDFVDMLFKTQKLDFTGPSEILQNIYFLDTVYRCLCNYSKEKFSRNFELATSQITPIFKLSDPPQFTIKYQQPLGLYLFMAILRMVSPSDANALWKRLKPASVITHPTLYRYHVLFNPVPNTSESKLAMTVSRNMFTEMKVIEKLDIPPRAKALLECFYYPAYQS